MEDDVIRSATVTHGGEVTYPPPPLKVQAIASKKVEKAHEKTPEEKAKRKEANREHYLKNIDKIRAYAKAYRQKQKEKCLQNEKNKN